MDTYKLKMKIGNNEFEAEGPTEIVQAQFEAWRSLVASQPAPINGTARVEAPPPIIAGVGEVTATGQRMGELMLPKIMRQEGRVVSLTARGGSIEDEILLVLLGQKNMRNNESVTGGEIVGGLRLTGRTMKRVDYQLDKLTDAGDTITIGVGRARRYRLTNQGFAKAQEIAMRLVLTVA